jgi:hypothetical protein
MKKLVTAFAACALAGLAFAQVESVNIVGYKTESYPEARGQPMQFVKVGGGTTLLTDILDMSTVSPFDDLLQIYDPVNGVFVDYMWNEVSWFNTLTDEEVEIEIVPGNAFLVLASGDWLFTGEVASITTYDHPIEAGVATFVGNAFPADTTLANFDWSAIAPYEDLIQLYDAVNGAFVDYMFDGADWFNTLNDEILPASTLLNDGFLILTGLTSITQSLVVQ